MSTSCYLAWLHELPCLVCGVGPIEAHHVRRFGERARDERAVPLCWLHHQWASREGIHRLGRRGFQKHFGIDLEAAILLLNATWQRINAKAA